MPDQAAESTHGTGALLSAAVLDAQPSLTRRLLPTPAHSCATVEVMELLAEGGCGVTERNLMQYLGVLEHRTNELLAHYCLLATDGSDAAAGERAAAVLTGRAGGVAPLQFAIEPPSSGSNGQAGAVGGVAGLGALAGPGAPAAVAGDRERPLSRGSLAARAREAVAKKAEHAVKVKALRGGPRTTRQ